MHTDPLHRAFTQHLGPGGPLQCAQAPGRVNLIGEHTDYNDGFVCPIAIDRHTTILFRPRADDIVRLHSLATNQTAEFSIANEIPKSPPHWSLYAKGVAEALRQRNLLSCGLDGLIDSTIPLGGGLSSSASLEIATGLALLAANKSTMNPADLAFAAQWAEHNYAGMPCGIMDQFISAFGKKNHALLLDCRDNTYRQIPITAPDFHFVIINSNVKHALATSEYALRRQQCEAAAKILGASLRDTEITSLRAAKEKLDTTLFRRARHVITENARTLAFADSLAQNDLALCGKLLYESHASLRDDFQVSCKELDILVEIAATVPGVFGARMTGGGFGGSIIALTTSAALESLTAGINSEYPKRASRTATIFTTTPTDGATVDKEKSDQQSSI